MKILSIEGHFGNMNGRRIDFTEGFFHEVLPNGWGKSTLCAFIRVMLYGLNTAKRDTMNALSDKTHYMPLDGQPMSGRLRVRYHGDVIVISRSTGKGGIMQDFDAYFEDTGERCSFLTAKNCGTQLIGMGEDAFLSSGFVDGTELQRSSNELRERMMEMAQSGDTQSRATQGLRALERWRLNLDSGNGHGTLPHIIENRQRLEEQAVQGQMLQEEILRQEERVKVLQETADNTRIAYDKAYRICSGNLVTEEERLNALIAQSGKSMREIASRTPQEALLRCAGEALMGYEGAERLEKEKRTALAQQGSRYDELLEQLKHEQHEDEVMRNEMSKPHVRWWALCVAFVFAVAAAATLVFDIQWGALSAYMPFILIGLTAVAIAVAFVGSVRKCDIPKRDFSSEKEEILRARAREDAEQQMAAAVLQDAYDTLMDAVHAIDPDINTIEAAADLVRRGQEDLQSLRRECNVLEDLKKKREALHLQSTPVGKEVEQAREALNTSQKMLAAGQRQLAQLQGRAQAFGSLAQLDAERDRLEAEQQDAEWQYQAICMALDATKQEHSTLAARVSPQIADKTREYMSFLTNGEYTDVQLDTALNARTAQADGKMLDALRLSVGTRDQLYFALRLAVCAVMSNGDDPTPLLLDDPLTTFDDDHTARAVELLHEISFERQVVLLTGRTV